MRRSTWIFLAAILLPSLVLAWMAVRSARDQQVILEHQQAIISQDVTDALAKQIQEQVDNARLAFMQQTDQLLRASPSTQALAMNFNRQLRGIWNLAEVGFAVDLRGAIYSPQPYEGALARSFRNENDRFLSNRENVEVFAQNATKARDKAALLSSNGQAGIQAPPSQQARPATQTDRGNESGAQDQTRAANQAPEAQQQMAAQQVAPQSTVPMSKVLNAAPQVQRLVSPLNNAGQGVFSNSLPEESDFRRVIGTESSGVLARFLEDKLRLLVWYRPNSGSVVFGAQVLQQKLIADIQPLLQSPELSSSTAATSSISYALMILDDRGKPVASSKPGFTADWKHPFAATEIGEALPHWEAALYLTDPKQINRSASTLQLALGATVAVLVVAILLGGWLMATDIRRQMRLAQLQTDFVSNVSHELKTPLTSIRMFADMLAEGRVESPERQANYLRIISAESARLTRLINNVLDFARMERGAPAGEHRPCDLVEVVREVVDTCQPHLDAIGVAMSIEIEAEELPLMGNRDALAQIILNLISNAEKYGGPAIVVRVRRETDGAEAFGVVEVLDRGPGIPQKKRETVFQPFQRLHESLSSGVSGSGLGLTLARRMAQAHGGDVSYSPRPGGGSCFTLKVPLTVNEVDPKSTGDAAPTLEQKP